MNHVDIISIFFVLIGIAAVFVVSLFRSSAKADWKDMAIVNRRYTNKTNLDSGGDGEITKSRGNTWMK